VKKLNINSKYNRYSLGALAVSFLLMPLKAGAEIYKCENNKKETYYNDKPCPVLDKETEISAVKDPKNGYVFPAFVSDKNKKNKGTLIKQRNTKTAQANTEGKDREDIESGRDNKENKTTKSKGGGNGGDLVQNSESTVSSSGRKSGGSSRRAPYDEKTRYIMKVEDDTREPLN